MEQQIAARIAELEAKRDALVVEANKQIFGFDVAIGELRRLLPAAAPVAAGATPPEPPTEAQPPEAADPAPSAHEDREEGPHAPRERVGRQGGSRQRRG